MWSVCHPVRPKGQDPPVVPRTGRGRRQRVVVKAPQTQLRPLWQNEQTTSRCQGCGTGHPAAKGWPGRLIPLALHFSGVRKYSDWIYFNVSPYSWCNWSLFLNRWYFHSHLNQHKPGVNSGKVTWLYWSLWKCTHRTSQSGPVLTENTHCTGRAKPCSGDINIMTQIFTRTLPSGLPCSGTAWPEVAQSVHEALYAL